MKRVFALVALLTASAAGAVDFPGMTCLNVKDAAYGAAGNGTDDDTTAIQDALDDACTTGASVCLPNGTYLTIDTLLVNDCQNVRVVGENRNTVVRYGGAGAYSDGGYKDIFAFVNCPGCGIEHLAIGASLDAGTTNHAAIGFYTNDDPAPTYNYSKHNFINDVTTGGEVGAADGGGFNLLYGAVFGALTPTSNGNNDFTTLTRFSVSNPRLAAVSIEANQSVGHVFTQPFFTGGQYGITVRNGGVNHGGSYRVYGGGMSQHSVADFDIPLGNGNNTVIDGVISEGSDRFIITEGPNANSTAATIRGNRFSADGINADGYWMLTKYIGNWIIEGNEIDGTVDTECPRIYINGAVETPNVATMVGNSFINCDSTLPPIKFDGTGTNSIFYQGNTFYDGEATAQVLWDSWTNSVAGQVTISGDERRKTVTFSTAQPNTSYFLSLTPATRTDGADPRAAQVLEVAKTTAGFTVQVEKPPGYGQTMTFDYLLRRN